MLDVENGVRTPYTQQMSGNIDSINDKVYLEFYDILDERAFANNEGGVNDLKNMKLLGLHIFDVKDFAFGGPDCACENHTVLMPVERSGNVAKFVFSAAFQPFVESKYINQAIVQKDNYLLFLKLVQSHKEVASRSHELDLVHFNCEITNITQGKSSHKRIYFNREIVRMGFVPVKVGDKIKIAITCKNSSDSVPNTVQAWECQIDPKGLQFADTILALQTWIAQARAFHLGFTLEHTYK